MNEHGVVVMVIITPRNTERSIGFDEKKATLVNDFQDY